MKRILVTGGAGFIGSHLVKQLLDSAQEYEVINLDLLTYAGNLENLAEVIDEPRHHFVHGDVRDSALVEGIFAEYKIDTVVNLAAESHVDRSIDEPQAFLSTNLLGTQVLLETAKANWKLDTQDNNDRTYRPETRFLQVSTDEVYGSLGEQGRFTEGSPLAPNSPYAASKAGADLLVRAYYATYGLPVCITRSSNNYGPYQHPEKLIPLMIDRCVRGLPLPIYGDGMQVRDWLHVSDHCAALLSVLHLGRVGEIYNIGGDGEQANLSIVRQILTRLGRDERLIQFVPDRPGHDRRYAIDHQKLTTQLGWHPTMPFEQGLAETVDWYLEHGDWLLQMR